MLVDNSLAQYGVDWEREAMRFNRLPVQERVAEFSQGLTSYTKEVLDDHPVSTPYKYWLGEDGELYSNPSREEVYKVANQFDPQERAGLPRVGFHEKLTPLLRNNPNKLIFWYSPIGPAAFDNNPTNPFKDINYTDGQLYTQYFDGEKVHAVAVKVTDEALIRQFMPEIFRQALFYNNRQDRISYFLTHPHLTPYTPDSFFEKDWDDGELYKDKQEQRYLVSDILVKLREALAQDPQKCSLSQKIVESLNQVVVTGKTLMKAYLHTIQNHMEDRGLRFMDLSGSCGGKRVDLYSLQAILGDNLPQIQDVVSLFSSTYRRLVQAGKPESEYHDNYRCPGCGEILSGEHKADTSSWRKKHDTCGYEFRCAPQEKAA